MNKGGGELRVGAGSGRPPLFAGEAALVLRSGGTFRKVYSPEFMVQSWWRTSRSGGWGFCVGVQLGLFSPSKQVHYFCFQRSFSIRLSFIKKKLITAGIRLCHSQILLLKGGCFGTVYAWNDLKLAKMM